MAFDLAESFIVVAEETLGASLPSSYRRSMLQENGGDLEIGEECWQQYPIADTSDRRRLSRTANHVLKETEQCGSWVGFPQDALAIAGNGTGDQLVFLRQDDSFAPAVWVWFHETGRLERAAGDFSELKPL